MSNHRVCCCTFEPPSVLWEKARRCDGEAISDPVPVIRQSFLDVIDNCGFPSAAVLEFDGECYFWNADSEGVLLAEPPDGVSYIDAESGVSKCACFICQEGLELIEPIPGNPSDGAANCCPSDTGCTTFGTKRADARVRITGTVTVRTKCSSSPDVFVENTYSFDDTLSHSGSAVTPCSRSGGSSASQGSETWNDCFSPFSSNPQLAFSASWDDDNGLTQVTATIRNLPNMPGIASGGQVSNFQIRLRGGNSDFIPLGAAWSNYDQDEYSYEEFVSAGCETQFAAAGRIVRSLNTDQNVVTISMRVVGAIDNIGVCP
jgi:hypothetical protein